MLPGDDSDFESEDCYLKFVSRTLNQLVSWNAAFFVVFSDKVNSDR